ncbi:MAG: hypothetical protein WC505_06855 [Patescibacteria group bacterium]
MTTVCRIGFAFSKTELENQMLVPLRAAFRHYCLVAWCRLQGTTYQYYDHWQAEVVNLTAAFFDALTTPSTLKPAGRIRAYEHVVAGIRDNTIVFEEAARDHYLDAFPEQEDKIKNKRLDKATLDKFWILLNARAKKNLVANKLVGKRWQFESVFGPIDA